MSTARRELLTRQIYDYLKDQLMARRLDRGTHLKAGEIAKELDVSRTTVRKAIDRLVDDGFLSIGDGGRPLVVSLPRRRRSPGENGTDFANQTENAYWAIFERVLTGQYGPGESVRGQELANELGVSLGTVRQALDWLCRGGLFVRRPRRGWSVVTLSEQDVEDAFRFRLLLEPEALRRAIPGFSSEVLDRLERRCEEILTSGDALTEYERRRADYEFHDGILEQAHSPVLRNAVGPLIQQCLLIGVFHPVGHSVSLKSFTEHLDVLAAVRAKDEPAAVSTLKAHLERSLAVFRKKYREA